MVVFLFLVCLIYGRNVESGSTYKEPEIKAVVINNTILLQCSINEQSKDNVAWTICPVGIKVDLTIYKNSTMLRNIDRWSVNTDNEHSELMITRAKREDAGRFTCHTEIGKLYSAHLVILASDPTCQSSAGGSSNAGVRYINENDVVSLQCEIKFWGTHPPIMQWKLMETPMEAADTITQYTNNSLTSSLHVLINSTRFPQATIQFTCKTFFEADEKYKTPSNSDYIRIWSSPIFIIQSGLDSPEISTEAKREQHVIYLPNNQIVSYVSCFLSAGVVIAMIAGVVLWKIKKINAKNKKTRRQLNPEQKTDYSEINEAEIKVELDVGGSRVKMNATERAIIHKQMPPGNQTQVQPTAPGAARSPSKEGVSYEVNREYGNISNGNERRENEEIMVYENDGQSDSGFTKSQTEGSASPSKRAKNKNYTILDPSTRASPAPPSVYKRLKNKPFKPNPAKQPVMCVKAEKFPFDSVDVEYCSIEGLKPKLPTPESSSLSGSSN